MLTEDMRPAQVRLDYGGQEIGPLFHFFPSIDLTRGEKGQLRDKGYTYGAYRLRGTGMVRGWLK